MSPHRSASNDPISFKFADFTLNSSQRQLLDASGKPIPLSSRGLDALLFLLRNQGEVVSKQDLMAAVWPESVVEENNLNQAIAAIRKALGENQRKDKLIVTVPGRGYSFVAQTENLSRSNKRRFLTSIAVAATLVVAVLFVYTQRTDSNISSEKSIAVLPFVAMSQGEEDQYFADGLTEELLNKLSNLEELSVTARTSSFFFKGQGIDVREIGESLGVAHILEGSVRRDGEKLRITAQLIDVRSGFHSWSENYDRNMEDIFTIQDDISNKVARSLSLTLLENDQIEITSHGTDNIDAQNLYLIAASRLRELRTPRPAEIESFETNIRRTRDLFREITLLDSQFAAAWAGLAESYILSRESEVFDESGSNLSFRQVIELAKSALAKAIALAPDDETTRLAAITVNTGSNGYLSQLDYLDDYESILESNPNNVQALEALATSHSSLSNFQLAAELYDRVRVLDPLSPALLMRGQNLVFLGDFAAAQAQFRQVGNLYPELRWQQMMALSEVQQGHLHHAELWLRESTDLHPRQFQMLLSLGDYGKGMANLRAHFNADDELQRELMELEIAMWERNYDFVFNAVDPAEPGLPMEKLKIYEDALYRTRRFEERIDLLFQRVEFEDLINKPLLLAPSRYAELHAALQLSGKTEQAARLAQVMTQLSREYFPIDSHAGLRSSQEWELSVLASKGQVNEALDVFEAMVAEGWRWIAGNPSTDQGSTIHNSLYWFEDNPALDSLRDHPRFKELLNVVKEDNARMLAELDSGLSLQDIIEDQ